MTSPTNCPHSNIRTEQIGGSTISACMDCGTIVDPAEHPVTGPTDVMRTVHVGTVPGEGLAVTADRYEDDPAVVALLETPGGVAHEWTPAVARALGHLLIAGADAAGAIR